VRTVVLAAPAPRRRSPGQPALAWLLAQKDHVVPIPGTRRTERLEENVGAAAAELTAEDLKRITRSSPTARTATATWRG
jgi:aryl-alcohol dehydrogenase-like predicted oxidoreductase